MIEIGLVNNDSRTIDILKTINNLIEKVIDLEKKVELYENIEKQRPILSKKLGKEINQ